MGGALRRGVKNFNAENRAIRLLNKDKLPKAPAYPSTVKKLKELQKDNEFVAEFQTKKDDRLLGMLQDIRVDSTDPAPKIPDGHATAARASSQGLRSLPTDRKIPTQTTSEIERQSVKMVPRGRLSVYMAQKLLVQHKQNPEEYNAERIAADYKLDLTDTRKVLDYFRTLEVVPIIPDETAKKLQEFDDILISHNSQLESGSKKTPDENR